jgi:hypothetical protein
MAGVVHHLVCHLTTEVLHGKRQQNVGIGPPRRRLSRRVHMGRPRSVARRSGNGKSKHRRHQRHQWRCAERCCVRLWLDRWPEGGKAPSEKAIGMWLPAKPYGLSSLIGCFCQKTPWSDGTSTVDCPPTAIFLGMVEQICSPYWNPLASRFPLDAGL